MNLVLSNRIYFGKYLSICLETESSLFIQNWHKSPVNKENFKFEMLKYTELYKKHKPSNTLWLQHNFRLDLDDDTKIWIEKNVNEPCFKYGNKKCAFVVSKSILAHMHTIDAFEKVNSCVKARHFASEEEARKWIFQDITALHEVGKEEVNIEFKGVNDRGMAVIEFQEPSCEITNTIKSFKGLIEEHQFIKENLEKFSSLTKREKEILKYLGQGVKQKDISNQLFISDHTVHTHIKNIYRKLQTNNSSEIYRFYKSFLD